jgi:3-hydroxyacyl-CoA dehydrogenase/enoyl-CoA hydratase/3-hydroxybutyryl-CoA epimerase
VIYYGAACHIDKALEIEARYFVDTLFSKETKILSALLYFYKRCRQRKIKTKGYDRFFQKSSVIGAGMMELDVNAKAGIDVVLKDG